MGVDELLVEVDDSSGRWFGARVGVRVVEGVSVLVEPIEIEVIVGVGVIVSWGWLVDGSLVEGSSGESVSVDSLVEGRYSMELISYTLGTSVWNGSEVVGVGSMSELVVAGSMVYWTSGMVLCLNGLSSFISTIASVVVS